MAQSLLILGCGYTGIAIALRALQAGWQVTGTSRSQAGCAALEALGIKGAMLVEGAADHDVMAAIEQADAVLCSIPADQDGCPAFRQCQSALATSNAQWTGYLSTTAVYGDRAGGWVFETDGPTATSPRAKARLLAEQQWQSLPSPGHVFRLPGIYGPGRSALDKVASGEARSIIKHNQIFSRCHRDDIASAVTAALDRPHPGTVFNICDDHPCAAPEVNDYAATLLGVAPPPRIVFETATLSPMARQFYADSKRVSNARAKAMLGWRPQHPTYKEGLRAILYGLAN
jgi:nucleoside-diphosphate-sugar epimerase